MRKRLSTREAVLFARTIGGEQNAAQGAMITFTSRGRLIRGRTRVPFLRSKLRGITDLRVLNGETNSWRRLQSRIISFTISFTREIWDGGVGSWGRAQSQSGRDHEETFDLGNGNAASDTIKDDGIRVETSPIDIKYQLKYYPIITQVPVCLVYDTVDIIFRSTLV